MRPELQTKTVDVLVAGAGPAGAALVLALRDHAPGLSVCLADRFAEAGSPVGEALPPIARPLLEHLGAWPAFRAAGHRTVYRSRASWGQARLGGQEFMNFALGSGWTLDRTRLNQMLAAQARVAATHSEDALIGAVAKDADGTWLCFSSDDALPIRARILVDATGRSAAVLRKVKHRPRRLDRLVAHVAVTEDLGGEAGVTVETCQDGWWYSAGLPNKRRLVAFMTDADIARRLSARSEAGFNKLLTRTEHIQILVEAQPLRPRAIAAASQVAPTLLPEGLVAVGDAAAAHDPISSYGIASALRSGIFAAYAIADQLDPSNPAGLERYLVFLAEDWRLYRESWTKYYEEETRWPDAPFWARRHWLGSAQKPVLAAG